MNTQFIINSSIKSLFTETLAVLCIRVKVINLINLSGTSNFFNQSISLFL